MDKSQTYDNGRRESTPVIERAHSEKPTNKMQSHKIPPDGGWGWMIVIAYALANVKIYFSLYIYMLHYDLTLNFA